MEQETSKKIGLRTVLGWVIGILFIIGGILFLFTNPIKGLFIIFAGLVVFPPFWVNVKEKWNFELSGALKLILFFILLVISSTFSANKNSSPEEESTQQSTTQKQIEQVKTYQVNEPISSNDMELVITSVEERTVVGGEYFNEHASEGGTLIVVQWQYKNTSDKPIGTFSQPSIKLADAKGTEYSKDLGKSSSYTTEIDLDRKILSDLNPGITVKDADVFEVSKEEYSKGGWSVIIKADGKNYRVVAN